MAIYSRSAVAYSVTGETTSGPLTVEALATTAGATVPVAEPGRKGVADMGQVAQRQTYLTSHIDNRWLGSFLARVPLFANLPATDLAAIAAKMRERVFRKGEVIFHKGDPGQVMYIIRSGQVRIFMVTEEEQEVSVAILSTGDFFGEFALLDDKPRSASAICMERTITLSLDRDDFRSHLREHPEVAIGIMALLTNRLRQANEQIENLTFLDVYGRVAKKLLDLAEAYGVRTDRGIVINLRLTQRDLASLVGTTRESVNRVLSTYQNRGMIDLAHQHITVLNAPALRRRVY